MERKGFAIFLITDAWALLMCLQLTMGLMGGGGFIMRIEWGGGEILKLRPGLQKVGNLARVIMSDFVIMLIYLVIRKQQKVLHFIHQCNSCQVIRTDRHKYNPYRITWYLVHTLTFLKVTWQKITNLSQLSFNSSTELTVARFQVLLPRETPSGKPLFSTFVIFQSYYN